MLMHWLVWQARVRISAQHPKEGSPPTTEPAAAKIRRWASAKVMLLHEWLYECIVKRKINIPTEFPYIVPFKILYIFNFNVFDFNFAHHIDNQEDSVRPCPFRTESIEWFMEDQTFSRRFGSTPIPSPGSKLDRRQARRLRKRDNMLTGGGERGEAPSHTTTRKPGLLYKSFTSLCYRVFGSAFIARRIKDPRWQENKIIPKISTVRY